MIRTKKTLGQHFLTNTKILLSIIHAAHVTKHDTVLEVGPGLGSLTRILTQNAEHVIAIEKDRELYAILQNTLSTTTNVTLIRDDALRTNFELLGLKHKNFKVVANIPYYITSAFIRKLLSKPPQPTMISLLIQKEVAQRIVSRPPHMSILSLSVLFFATPKIIGYVSKRCFSPQPRVDSAIIALTPKTDVTYASLEPIFFKLIRAGFAQKRKTLLNSLSASLKIQKEHVEALLKQASITKNARAQEISFDGWIKLAVIAKKTTL